MSILWRAGALSGRYGGQLRHTNYIELSVDPLEYYEYKCCFSGLLNVSIDHAPLVVYFEDSRLIQPSDAEVAISRHL